MERALRISRVVSNRRICWLAGVLLTLWLPACSSPSPSLAASPTSLPPTAAPTPSPTRLPSSTVTSAPATSIPTPLRATSTPEPQLCSPLKDVAINELQGIIAGDTYKPPLPGRDDGHHGVDFAFYSRTGRSTMLGWPIQSAFNGVVAAVIPDRKPYGNTIIIETPLSSLPAGWLAALHWPIMIEPVKPDPRLTCATPLALPRWDASHQSVYLLYGHMNQPSTLRVGDSVACGQIIGEVGTTGASVNPHLHFEARLGYAQATFTSFGHYDTHTTDEERNNYCVWRVSGWFQLVDPMMILTQIIR